MRFTHGLIQALLEFGRPFNQIQVPTTTTSQDLNAMIGSISRELVVGKINVCITYKTYAVGN